MESQPEAATEDILELSETLDVASDAPWATAAEMEKRWRLLLGQEAESILSGCLDATSTGMDQVLRELYEADRKGNLKQSKPTVHRWLGDIRKYFPRPVVQFLQRDAYELLGVKQLLLEPELLETFEVDASLVATLLLLKDQLPEQTRTTARQVVGRLVEQVLKKLKLPLQQAVSGSLHRIQRTRRPRPHEIDWVRTIFHNLRHYQPKKRTIIPEQLIGQTHKHMGLQDVILCLDQSGSMANSLVYAGILGSVLATIPALRFRCLAFDSAVVNLTDQLRDPVELLFAVQLGGGTDIQQALGYCQHLVERPRLTTIFLVTDLYEGSEPSLLLQRAAALVRSGVQLIVLLALDDAGTPSYHQELAGQLHQLGVFCFGCSPDQFPDLLSAALQRRDLSGWQADNRNS